MGPKTRGLSDFSSETVREPEGWKEMIKILMGRRCQLRIFIPQDHLSKVKEKLGCILWRQRNMTQH